MHRDYFVIEHLEFSPEGIVDVLSGSPDLPVQRHFTSQAKLLNLGADKIYFSGEFPSVYFKAVESFEEKALKNIVDIQKSIWNQGKVAFLVVESPSEIRVYNCYEKPVKWEQEDRNIEDLELFKASKQAERDMEILRQVFGMVSIETGGFWKYPEFSKKLEQQRRVEQALMDNLKKTRAALRNAGLPTSIIHDLLLRSLFTLYLEDRKATDAAFYGQFKKDAKSYFEVLEDLKATYLLFEKLEDAFNGNLSPVTDNERKLVTVDHLQRIKECFWSKLKENGQQKLCDWRIFDFEIIPIELISAIYEDFLAEQEGKDNQEKTGAYYTPRPLAEFVLNKVLPYPSENDSRHAVKILDPTCGSGIFLVESLNRLLDRWEFAHSKKPDFETIKQIALDNIFGVDIQGQAVKVAAFSLYLAMLNRLDPKILWQQKRFPYLIFDPENGDPEKQGRNLFVQSSLASGAFEQVEYDLVVGNPPFKRDGLDENMRAYLTAWKFPQEAVTAFLARATELCPTGKIALVFAAKVLFNKESKDQNVRKFLFQECYAEAVYNFAALRRLPKTEGGNFFPSASGPAAVIFYSKNPPAEPSDRILYCAPKTALKNRLIDGMVVDTPDVKYLPRTECRKPDTIIWKAAMWGTERDFRFVRHQLLGRDLLKKYLRDNNWKKNAGVGFGYPSKKSENNPTNYEIKEYKHLPLEKIERYYSMEFNAFSIEETNFWRTGKISAFKQPHILIKKGQEDKRFCVSYIDFNCSFTDGAYGIHIEDHNNLKILTAFLNSKIATYNLFLSLSSWGVEREQVQSNEVFDLPDLCFSLPSNAQERIVDLIDQIITLKKNQLAQGHELEALEKAIDEAFFEALDYSKNERILIEDFIKYDLDAFQNKGKSHAHHLVTSSEMQLYATKLCETLNEFLRLGSQTTAWASVFETSSRLPLQVVCVHFNGERAPGTVSLEIPANLHETLKAIEADTYRKHSESLYFRKFVRFFTADRVYIIKPNEKRFWSRPQALNDADEVIAEVLSMQKK